MGFEMVVIGASLGGLKTLKVLLSGLPARFPSPVAIVQHRSTESDELLPRLLQESCALPVSEPEDKEEAVPSHVYVAPADYHLLVEKGRFALSTEAPVNYSRPSVDVLFETAADSYGMAVVGVILTGANADGASGVRRVKRRGGLVVVQRPEDAESEVMPAAAIAAVHVDRVLPLMEIAPFLVKLCAPGANLGHG